MIKKFNLRQAKQIHIYPYSSKLYDYQPAENVGAIRRVLLHEAADYVRRTKKIPDDKQCITYTTKQGKIAVLTLETPKKRFLFAQAENQQLQGAGSDKMNALKEKYGFIPRPINVLRKFVDYGYMKSQDVEHIYHNEPVDWKITDERKDMEDAYREVFHEKDVLIDGFNGYSCMSEEPEVGTFYYFFGARMLIFYKKNSDEIVGRMVLWPWKNRLHAYKGYVKTQYQFSAHTVVEQLRNNNTITFDAIPSDFTTTLTNMEGKNPYEILDEIGDECRVPYIDEDLALSEDKTTLSFNGCYECKRTDADLLYGYGKRACEECGDEVDEDDGVWVGDDFYCTECARRCSCCDEWYAPDEDGSYTKNDGWVCERCLDEKYTYCEECEEYLYNEEVHAVKDKDGNFIDMCEDCVEKTGAKRCSECGYYYIPGDDDPKDYELCWQCRQHANVKSD